MEPNRSTAAVWIGALGGVAATLAPGFPWLIDDSQHPSVMVNGLIAGPYIVILGVVMTVAAVFLMTDADPRKATAVLGAVSLAVLVFAVPVLVHKEAGLFSLVESQTTKRGVGVYLSIVGGVLGLVATAIATREIVAPADGHVRTAGSIDLGDVTGPAGSLPDED